MPLLQLLHILSSWLVLLVFLCVLVSFGWPPICSAGLLSYWYCLWWENAFYWWEHILCISVSMSACWILNIYLCSILHVFVTYFMFKHITVYTIYITVADPGEGGHPPSCPTPRSVLRASNNEDLYFLQKCVLSICIYNIALQNTDFGVLQKSSKTFSDFHFLSTPPPPPSTKSWIRHCISLFILIKSVLYIINNHLIIIFTVRRFKIFQTFYSRHHV